MINGITTMAMMNVMAAALERSTAPKASARTASRASTSPVPTTARATGPSVSESFGYAGGANPFSRRRGWLIRNAGTAAATPVTKASAPSTTAFAASTRPRRGVAVNVVRMMPRRNSVVMNKAAMTAIAMNPMRMPPRVSRTTSLSPPVPGGSSPRSPAPDTVNVPASSV